MAPGHVAYGLGAQYGLRITAETVTAWERGLALPTEYELTALAGVLWCAPGELLTAARSLREHRVSRALSPDELAARLGMAASAYLRMEESGRWRGNERQSAALSEALGLTPADFVTATGRGEELAELLRGAVTTRWQAYSRPVAKLVPVDRRRIQEALERLHGDYQALMVSTLSWSSAGTDRPGNTGEEGRAFLTGIVPRFWEAAGPSA
ncbi:MULTISPECIES: helix-turn-helix domain-containing protein [Streptomyces]|uniref:Helix-turn-helix transcriptional regulator n=1 Tax=Streptomyces drozdowiczii TaxID=202862 RepID=A0ABY6PRD3_9ACTN|nr:MULTISPECIES: helix-turn-helix transcriptional regulator [Streptomyces]MCX0246130.1 helix-turn-helix transcriptional regulator [Streptomyces drozdowiczii]OKJ77687.1 DNA-binding protein [Streptomyces sp. CB02460]UZK54319.1 helix-turn-helix transcriptional regulator [Streptomyces drozdowiczii]